MRELIVLKYNSPLSLKLPKISAMDAQSSLPVAIYHAVHVLTVPVAVGEGLIVTIAGRGKSLPKAATQ